MLEILCSAKCTIKIYPEHLFDIKKMTSNSFHEQNFNKPVSFTVDNLKLRESLDQLYIVFYNVKLMEFQQKDKAGLEFKIIIDMRDPYTETQTKDKFEKKLFVHPIIFPLGISSPHITPSGLAIGYGYTYTKTSTVEISVMMSHRARDVTGVSRFCPDVTFTVTVSFTLKVSRTN